MDEVTKLNRKQAKKQKSEQVMKLTNNSFEVCRGDDICCGVRKPVSEFSPSNLKCICRDCTRKIRERNRQDKIDKDEDHYIYEKIRSTILRVSIFSSILKCSDEFFYAWIKSQSVDPHNEHFDHVLPIHFFRQFSNVSPYLLLRDSWINFMPLKESENLKKGTKVDFDLFKNQLEKARQFILNYHFKANVERCDMINNYNYITSLFNNINGRNRNDDRWRNS